MHIYGTVKIQTSEELLTSLHTLVNKYEQQSEHPISLNDMSKKTMRQVTGIIGFEIEINDIQAVNKLSQGREHDHPKIISELEKQGSTEKEIAKAMRKLKP